ncbi:MAG TPA: zf-HC2 domain-containing protein [Kofleriaceae bacterium]|nr:zf-HC2 domain-containing protein [Kofleriaceae bacterium]
MTCKRACALSSAYLNDELSAPAQRAVRGHLRVCESCRKTVEDEAAMVAGLAALAGSDDSEPPPGLWDDVAARLAAAEIADSRRPRWQWAWARVRPHLGVAGLLFGAAVAAVVLWGVANGFGAGDAMVAGNKMARADAALAARAMPAHSFAEARRQDLARADSRYRDIIAELRVEVDSQRPGWSPAREKAVAAELAAIERQKLAAREQLLVGGIPDVRARDALYAAYRAEVAVLERAVMIEAPRR